MTELTSRPLPPTSLVIPTRNRPEMLHDTLNSILSGREVPCEIIIVDQSDTSDETLVDPQERRGCAIRYLWPQPPGVSLARNRGVMSARNPIVIIADDDVLVDPDWLGALVRGLLALGERGMVTGRVLTFKAQGVQGFAPSTQENEQPAVYKGRPGKDVLFSANMAVFRDAFLSVRGFDVRLGPGTRFPAAEDNDLGFRWLESGRTIVYVPGAVMYHRAWRTARHYMPLRWRYGTGRGAFYAKHLSLRDRYMLARMAGDVRTHLASGLRLWRKQPRRARGDTVLAAGILWGALRWWLRPRRTRVS